MPRNTTSIVCLVASVAAGWVIMSWLGLVPRQITFGMVLITGLFLLILMWRQGGALADKSAGAGVGELLKGSGCLSPEGAREWLDKFLAEQQDKK